MSRYQVERQTKKKYWQENLIHLGNYLKHYYNFYKSTYFFSINSQTHHLPLLRLYDIFKSQFAVTLNTVIY